MPETARLQMEPRHLDVLRRILAEHTPSAEVWAYLPAEFHREIERAHVIVQAGGRGQKCAERPA